MKNNPLRFTDPTGREEKGTKLALASYSENQCLVNDQYLYQDFTSSSSDFSIFSDPQSVPVGLFTTSQVRAPLSTVNGVSGLEWSMQAHPNFTGNSTSPLQIYDPTKAKDSGFRLDYGDNKASKAVDWHVNQKGQYLEPAFGPRTVNDHLTVPEGLATVGEGAKLVKGASNGLLIVGAAADAYSIYTSENKPREVSRVVGGWSGAWAGGEVGASIGAGATIETGPGALVGGFVGGIIGSIGGYMGGGYAGEKIYDNAADYGKASGW